jgi:hypothetical protein
MAITATVRLTSSADSIILTLRLTKLERAVLAIDEASFVQAFGAPSLGACQSRETCPPSDCQPRSIVRSILIGACNHGVGITIDRLP